MSWITNLWSSFTAKFKDVMSLIWTKAKQDFITEAVPFAKDVVKKIENDPKIKAAIKDLPSLVASSTKRNAAITMLGKVLATSGKEVIANSTTPTVWLLGQAIEVAWAILEKQGYFNNK